MDRASAGCCILALGQKALEDQNRSHLIDDGAMLLAGFAQGVQMAMSLTGGESLVREMDGQAKRDAEFFGEGLGLERLWADLAGHVKGVANDDFGDSMLAEDATDGFDVGVWSAAMQREERLHGQAEWVCDGESDAFAADVQSEEAGRQYGSRRIGWERVVHFRSVAGRQAEHEPGRAGAAIRQDF